MSNKTLYTLGSPNGKQMSDLFFSLSFSWRLKNKTYGSLPSGFNLTEKARRSFNSFHNVMERIVHQVLKQLIVKNVVAIAKKKKKLDVEK